MTYSAEISHVQGPCSLQSEPPVRNFSSTSRAFTLLPAIKNRQLRASLSAPPLVLQHAREIPSEYLSPAMPRAFPPVEQDAIRRNASAPRTPLSASLIESVAGFSAGVVSCLAAHPLDLLKNRLQLNTQTRSRPGDSFRILSNVIKDEGGVKALYRGLWPNLLGNSLGWGLYFLFYGNLKELFRKRRREGEHLGSADFFSASIIAGTTVSLMPCTTPADLFQASSLARAPIPSGSSKPACSSAAQTTLPPTHPCPLACATSMLPAASKVFGPASYHRRWACCMARCSSAYTKT